MKLRFARALLLGVSAFAAPSAWAHLVSTRFGELYSGILHPLTTLEHLVPWLGLALVAGLQPPKVARWVLAAFPSAVLVGVMSAASLPAWAWPRWTGIASMVLLGVLAAANRRLHTPQLILLCAVIGWCHGFANAASDLAGNAWLLYCCGVALAAYVLAALATASARALTVSGTWGTVAVRATGSWVAAAGVLYLGVLTLVPA